MLAVFLYFVVFQHLVSITTSYLCGHDLTKHRNFPLVDHGSNCGKGSTRQGKIMNGKRVGLGEFPWVAFIRMSDTKLNKSRHCSGSLVSERYVVSAGHCFTAKQNFKPTVFKVTLNLRSLDDYFHCEEACEFQKYDVEEVIIHPISNHSVVYKDIALARLAQKVPLNEDTQPICLPVACDVVNTQFQEGYPVTAAGWGYIKEVVKNHRKEHVDPTGLMKANMSVTECNMLLLADPLVWSTDLKVCAKGSNRQRSPISLCGGDSGGPLMVDDQGRMVLAGVASTSQICDEDRLDGVSVVSYTKVSAFMSWILDSIRP